MSAFKKATRQAAKLRAAICGTAGSGKTYGALNLARGLAGPTGKIALIDTERGSASLYADLTDFDVAELVPPYSPARYRDLIVAAAKEYDVLVIDSLSHAWSGEGGVLDLHDKASSVQKNSYAAWRDVTPQHNQLVDSILSAPCHVITTMRSKTAYELQEDNRGKKTPVKIGLAPIQRDGMEYEFTLVLDVSVKDHVAASSKDRTRLWDGRYEVLSVQHGEELRAWLESGEKLDLGVIQERLLTLTAGNEVSAYWRELGLKPYHPQYQEVLALFSATKQRIEQAAKAALDAEVAAAQAEIDAEAAADRAAARLMIEKELGVEAEEEPA